VKKFLLSLVALSLLVGCSDPSGGGERFVEEYANGQLKSLGYITGKNVRTGEWTFWYANGQKKSEGRFVDHQKEGLWTYWHENGQKQKERSYKNGQRVDGWPAWGEQGAVPQTYKEVLEHAIELHEDGNALDLLRFYAPLDGVPKRVRSGGWEEFAAEFASGEKYIALGWALKYALNHKPVPVRSVGNTVTLKWGLPSAVSDPNRPRAMSSNSFSLQKVDGRWSIVN
jgi:hypothetical protein